MDGFELLFSFSSFWFCVFVHESVHEIFVEFYSFQVLQVTIGDVVDELKGFWLDCDFYDFRVGF